MGDCSRTWADRIPCFLTLNVGGVSSWVSIGIDVVHWSLGEIVLGGASELERRRVGAVGGLAPLPLPLPWRGLDETCCLLAGRSDGRRLDC